MAGRELIYQALRASAAIADEVDARIYQSGSLGIGNAPDEPSRPYILFIQLPSVPFPEVRHTARAARRTYQVYVYADRGDYGYIDKVLGLVRETVLGLVDSHESTGVRCLDVRWTGDSQDIVDTLMDLSYKFTTFQLVTTE